MVLLNVSLAPLRNILSNYMNDNNNITLNLLFILREKEMSSVTYLISLDGCSNSSSNLTDDQQCKNNRVLRMNKGMREIEGGQKERCQRERERERESKEVKGDRGDWCTRVRIVTLLTSPRVILPNMVLPKIAPIAPTAPTIMMKIPTMISRMDN